MTIKEKILKTPVWKVAITTLLGLIITTAVIEEIAIHTVFNVINHSIDRFTVIFNEDDEDMKTMMKESEKQDVEYKARENQENKELAESNRKQRITSFCTSLGYITQFKLEAEEARKYHQEDAAREHEASAEHIKDQLDHEMKVYGFNPSMCKDNV